MIAKQIRRGSAAIQEAIDARDTGGSKSFKPFLPNIFWKDDQETRYLLFMNPIDELYQFDVINFIPTEAGFPEMTVAKTDVSIGAKKDRFVDDWDAKIKVVDLLVALELEPQVEMVKGREIPVGFEVATNTFDRKIIDEDGEVTEDTEEVTSPIIGLVCQSPFNFYNMVRSYDSNDGPIDETPLRVIRIGEDQNTAYKIDGYPGQEIDFTNLVEYLDGFSYIADEIEENSEVIADLEGLDLTRYLGSIILDKKIEELLDPDRYDELYEGVTESMDRFGGGKSAKSKSKKVKTTVRKSRPSAIKKKKAAKNEDADVEDNDADSPDDSDDSPDNETERKIQELRKMATEKHKKVKAKRGK